MADGKHEVAVGSEDRIYEYDLDENGQVTNFREKNEDGKVPKGSKTNPITG